MQFWEDMRENNVDIDFGEEEWKEVIPVSSIRQYNNTLTHVSTGFGKKKGEG